MKVMTFLTLLALSVNTFANVIEVNTSLKNKEIYDVIYQSVSNYLEYETDEISGGLYGDLGYPTIIELTKEKGVVVKLKVQYRAFFMTTDYDFGDPVDEEYTQCTSVLAKGKDGKYSVELTETTCDFNPATDVSVDYYDYDPCCVGGGVVDSNMCFDSYEEADQYCAAN